MSRIGHEIERSSQARDKCHHSHPSHADPQVAQCAELGSRRSYCRYAPVDPALHHPSLRSHFAHPGHAVEE